MSLLDTIFMSDKKRADINLKAAEEFLKTNKEKPGIITLESGLQIEVIKNGEGEKPYFMQNVTCHYHGTLINGTVFDSTLKRKNPASFHVCSLIKGWREGLQMMPAGSKWRLYIPPHLAYGNQQVSHKIGPNCALIFDVELISVN